jgi:hypothetical protein
MVSKVAAGYCSEPSVESFLEKVERGIYPQPKREKGCLPKWHRLKLDKAIALRHGIPTDDIGPTEDASELI